MIKRTGLAPWEFKFPFPGSLTSTCGRSFADEDTEHKQILAQHRVRDLGRERLGTSPFNY